MSTATRRRPILSVVDYYSPGYKAGGPITAVRNLVETLGDEFQFNIITRDRDLGDETAYPGVHVDTWQQVGRARVFYGSPRALRARALRRMLKTSESGPLYLNSFFSVLSVRMLVLRRLGRARGRDVIVAPRGEFAPSALSIKPRRKRLYLHLARLAGLCRGVTWQASSPHEADHIRSLWPDAARRDAVVLAPELPTKVPAPAPGAREPKQPGCARAVYIARVSRVKNLDGALRALALLDDARITFDIYGPLDDPAYWRECERLVPVLPANVRVQYRGVLAPGNLAAVLRGADVYFLPTHGENYGHSIVEALGAGCPVLISDRTPWQDVEQFGAGWTVPPADTRRMAAVLRHVASMDETEHARYAAAARRYAAAVLADARAREQNRALFAATRAPLSSHTGMHVDPRRHLLLLTQYYRPEPNFITADIAEAVAADMRVTVITAFPNYPRGKFYSGRWHWWPRRTQENGVTVWRLPMIPDHSLSVLRRSVCYASFAAAATIVAPLVARRVDTVLVYHTPLTTALAALWFRFVHRARIVYASADLWPESFVGAGVARGRIIDLVLRYRRFINGFAHLLICSTRGTLELYAAQGYPRSQLRYVPVWVEAIPAALPPVEESEPDPPRIVYAGNLGPAQRLNTLIEAAALLAGRGRAVVVDIYGSGSAEASLRSLANEVGAANVTFKGRLPPGEAFAASARATAQYVALARSPLFAMTVPSKLAFCCAAAAPLLYGLDGESAALAVESGGGIAFDPEHAASLAAAIERLLSLRPAERQQMRHRLRAYYNANFAREELLRRYLELVRAETARVPSPPTSQPVLELSQDRIP